MAALVQSHLISTELTGAFLLLFCLLRLRQTLRPARLLAWVKAALLAFGLSAWFLVPFASTALSVPLQVNEGLPGKPQSEGLTLMQLINPFGPGFGGTTPGTSSDMSLTLGLPLVLGVALVVFCLLRRDRWELGAPPAADRRSGCAWPWCSRCRSSPGILWKAGWALPPANWRAPSSIPGGSWPPATLLLCAAALLALQLIARHHAAAARLAAGGLAVAAALSVGVFQMQLLTCTEPHRQHHQPGRHPGRGTRRIYDRRVQHL